jgi:hypothetical protein
VDLIGRLYPETDSGYSSEAQFLQRISALAPGLQVMSSIKESLMSNWKEEFVNCLEGSTVEHSQLEKALAIKAENMPTHIYRYQPDINNRRESLANDKVWLCSPDKYNDPYDCEFTISALPSCLFG